MKLVCPVCRQPLSAQASHCDACGLDFPVSQGVPCLFGPGKEDLWSKNQSGMAKFLADHPKIAARLENCPEESLNGADTFAKASLRMEQGRLQEAIALQQAAWRKSYPAQYIEAFEAQLDFIAQSLGEASGPIVDIASGRGMLVARLLEKASAPLIATDISPFVLANSLAPRWPEELARGRLRLMAFDASAIPFGDRDLPAVTTCLGLQNIPHPENVARELRRVCGGKFYALCEFFPEDDAENQEAAARHGLAGAYAQSSLGAMMERAGWRVRFHEGPLLRQPPTPEGEILGGRVDSLPVRETFCRLAVMVCE